MGHCNTGKSVEFVKVKVGFPSYKLNRVLLFNHVVPRVYAEPKDLQPFQDLRNLLMFFSSTVISQKKLKSIFLTTSTFNPDFQLDFWLKDFQKKH